MELSRSVSCGAWGCRPAWLQRFATPRTFLWVYGLLGTIQTMAYLYFVATLTTMERRFKIPSRTTGLMLSGNEISQILLSLLLTYFGGRGNRPRWIAWGVAISALSCFILALPHALYGAGSTALSLTLEHSTGLLLKSRGGTNFSDMSWSQENVTYEQLTAAASSVPLCGVRKENNASVEETCSAAHNADTQDGNYSLVPILLVFLSQFVLGIGTTLYYALGQIYLDDNTRKTNTPMLLGLTLALRTLGPALGFALGYACLSLYVDPTLTPLIDMKDPRWVGAWWIGWLLLGTAMLIFAALIALFPRRLPLAPSKDKTVRLQQNGIESERLASVSLLPQAYPEPEKPTLKEFPVALQRLLSNQLLMFNIMSSVVYILGASGYITFSTKYMEVQYNQSAAGASMLAGTSGLTAMVLGFLVSGLVISKFRPRPRLLLSWNVVAGMAYFLAEIGFVFIGCPDHTLHGVSPDGGAMQLLSECNIGCSCPSDLRFSPVCIGEVSFYSACHAGCSEQYNATGMSSNMTFSDCKCASEALFNFTEPVTSMVATNGLCKTDCSAMLLTFIIISCFMHMIGSSARIGNILVNYRCVEPQDKAFAQGLALVLISLLAFIPGPIMFGAIIDSSCQIWDESCGRRGNCSLYNKANFRLYMNLTAALITSVAVVLDAVVWYKGKNLDLYGDDEDKPKTHVVAKGTK